MRTALDTNILSALWSRESTVPRLVEHLASAKNEGALLVCPAVYSESLAHPAISEADVRNFFDSTGVVIDLSLHEEVWHMAGVRYGLYAARRRKAVTQQPRRIVADYIIGAHALLQADRLMTLDPATYRHDFPELRLYDLA
jgi:predicted nucleic acid-binding protein